MLRFFRFVACVLWHAWEQTNIGHVTRWHCLDCGRTWCNREDQ